MGLLDNQTYQEYYSSLDYGNYQFVTIDNIINAFMIAYVGEDKIISKVNRTDVQFHAMRAIQELSYDVFRSVKSQEIEIPPGLSMPLPQDYVNYVKIVRVDDNGIERILYPTGKTSNPFPVSQDADGAYVFATDESLVRQGGIGADSDTLQNWKSQSASVTGDDVDDTMMDYRGRRYGLDPQYAQSNGTFVVDLERGVIFFGSSLAGQTITLKYISDGLGTDSEMVVHKFCEEACYKWIAYGVLSTRSNMPEYVVQRFKKEKFAETRKAKIRLSNIKMEEFTQVLKGMGKQIK